MGSFPFRVPLKQYSLRLLITLSILKFSMNQSTIMVITLALLFIAEWSTAKYLLVDIDDGVDDGVIDNEDLGSKVLKCCRKYFCGYACKDKCGNRCRNAATVNYVLYPCCWKQVCGYACFSK